MTGARTQPMVSVVIPAHQSARFLAECLTSVFAQRGPHALDVVVVDDASTDGTGDVARTFQGVRVIRQTANQGPAAARNAGIAAARGEFVAFLDADDLWPAGSLEARLEVLQRQPSAALVFGDCRQFDDRGPRSRTLFEEGGFGGCSWGRGDLVPDAFERLLADNFITTGSVVARRSALSEAGGFADELRLVEDLDLWLRLAKRHTVAWHGAVGLLRRRHGANLSRDSKAMSLAYLEVLRRQIGAGGADRPHLDARLAALMAQEHRLLAERALAQGQPSEAVRWARASLEDRPTVRALWTVAQAMMSRLLHPRLRHPPAPPR